MKIGFGWIGQVPPAVTLIFALNGAVLAVNPAQNLSVSLNQTPPPGDANPNNDAYITAVTLPPQYSGNLLTYSLETYPTNGALYYIDEFQQTQTISPTTSLPLSLSTSTLYYMPYPGFPGSDSFLFAADDGVGDSGQASVNLTGPAVPLPLGPNPPPANIMSSACQSQFASNYGQTDILQGATNLRFYGFYGSSWDEYGDALPQIESFTNLAWVTSCSPSWFQTELPKVQAAGMHAIADIRCFLSDPNFATDWDTEYAPIFLPYYRSGVLTAFYVSDDEMSVGESQLREIKYDSLNPGAPNAMPNVNNFAITTSAPDLRAYPDLDWIGVEEYSGGTYPSPFMMTAHQMVVLVPNTGDWPFSGPPNSTFVASASEAQLKEATDNPRVVAITPFAWLAVSPPPLSEQSQFQQFGTCFTIGSPAPPVISPTSYSATTDVGVSFTYQISASNFPASYTASGLPPSGSLTLNPQTGLISGTPTDADIGAYTVNLTATNSAGTGQATLALTIPMPTPVKQGLGVYHWGANYRVNGSIPAIVDGAQQIQGLGSQYISLAMSYKYTLSNPYNTSGSFDYMGPASDWGSGPINSLTDLAKSPPFQQVFQMPFKVYMLTAYPFGDEDYLGNQNLAAEQQEITNLVTYLLTTYQGTGKTFIIKNWEGDNAMSLENTGQNPSLSSSTYNPPPPALTTKMINWLNARHQGVLQGRINAGAVSGVVVHDAVEFNLVDPIKWGLGQACMLSTVIPNVQSDYVDYSSYDTINTPATANLAQAIGSDMTLIQNYTGGRPLYIGEFEFETGQYSDAATRTQVAAQAFLNAGCPYVIYWEIEDGANGATGYQLVNPDGSHTVQWTVLNNMLAAGNHAPIAQNQAATVNENSSKPITLAAADADNDILSYSVVSGPAHGSLSGTAPNLTYTPTSGYTGSDSFIFQANDGLANSNQGTVSITVAAQPPSVNIDFPCESGINALANCPATISGAVTIGGWAIDNVNISESAISTVTIYVDGIPISGNVAHSQSRPDVCAAYPGRPDCPNVGFAFTWNTAAVANGSHTISVDVTDSDDALVSSAGDTIIVANQPPIVSAGPDQTITLPSTATLQGSITPGTSPIVSSTWSVISGPANVIFSSTYTPVTIASFSLPGTYGLQLQAYDGQYIVNSSMTVTATLPPPPVITSTDTASGVAGSTFTYTITATNDPAGYGISSLPAGLSINSVTGLISGVPSAVGISSITLSATNAGGTGTEILVLTVTAALPPPPIITSTDTASGVEGSTFTYMITAINDPTRYGASNLPAGLSVDSQTGLISGIPTQTTSGAVNVTLSVSNAGGASQSTLMLTILPPANPVITSFVANPQTIIAGQVTLLSWTTSNVMSASLDNGIGVVSVNGSISINPSVTTTYTLTATGAAGTTPVTQQVIVTVAPTNLPAPDLSALNGNTFTLQDSLSLNYSGNATGFNWEFDSANLSAASSALGIASGSLANVPTTAPRLSLASLSLSLGQYTIKVQAFNGNQTSPWGSATITLVGTDLAMARVHPNPFRAARGDTIVTFDQLTADSAVKIYTVSGRWVKTLQAPGGSAVWDLTTDAGDKAASGLYLYLITDGQGNKTRGKFALIR